MTSGGIFSYFYRLRINTRIAALVIAGFLPIWLYVSYLIVSTYHHDHQVLVSSLRATTSALRRNLDETVGGYEAAMRVLALSPSLANEDLNQFRHKAEAVLTWLPGLNIVALNSNGAQLLNTRVPPGKPLPVQPPPFFPRAKAAQSPFLSDLFLGPILDENLIALVTPIQRNGQLDKALALSLNTETLAPILKREGMPTSWVTGLFDQTGTIIARSHSPERYVGKKGIQAVLDSLTGPPEGLVETRILEGTPVVLAYSRSARYGWTAVIAVPKDVLEADLKRHLWQSLIGGTATLILTLFLAHRLAQGIALPIHALVEPATAIGKGAPFSLPPLNLKEADEVGQALTAAAALISERTRERDSARVAEQVMTHRHDALRALNEIAAVASADPADQLNQALALATDHLGLTFGFIGRRDGDLYTILHVTAPPELKMAAGISFPIDDSYGTLPLAAMDVVAIPDVGRSQHAQCACYRRFGYEAYIGAPIFVRGQTFGAACFASRRPREQGFQASDIEFVRLLARWAGALLERDIANRELISAKDIAEEAQRATVAQAERLAQSNADLEQFAYVASHDLRTPLRNIISYAQLLERRYQGRLDSDADDFINFIVENGRQMTVLITDLLEYSRVASQPRDLQPVPAREAVDRAVANLSAGIDEAGAQVCIGNLPVVLGEPTQLISLFQNLLGNAVKYRSPGRPPRVTVTAEPSDGDFWRFAIADNGIGIAPEYFEKIFDIFQRLTPSEETAGTGIGLTLCRRIVNRFGGSIWLDSTPGFGSTFYFTLKDASAHARDRALPRE